MNIKRTVAEWCDIKAEIEELNIKERQLRAEITSEVLGGKLEGSVTLRDDDLKITATAILNRSLDQSVLESVWNELSWEEQQAIEYKPKLKVKVYKTYEETESQLNEAVTVKPGMAQLRVAV